MDEPVKTGSQKDAEPIRQPQGDALRHSLTWLWWLPTLGLLYVLSIGPATKFWGAFPAARPAIEAFYKPVTALIDHSPRVQSLALWYLTKIWGFPPPAPTTPTAPTNSVPVSGK